MTTTSMRLPHRVSSLVKRFAGSALLGGSGLIIITLTIALYFVALPIRAAELRQTAAPAVAAFGQLAPEEALLLEAAGLSIDAYAFGMLGIETAAVLAFAAVTGVTLWRRPGEPMLVFVALAAVLYVAFFSSPPDVLLRLGPLWSTLSLIVQALGMWTAVVFFYIFPTGSFVPRWTRLLALA